jgi:hypothetical protein
MSMNPRFERAILAEFALLERRAQRREPFYTARALAHRAHRGRWDLLAHLRRVADAVPDAFHAVAWLHHAREAHVTSLALKAAGLTSDEVGAVDLLASTQCLTRPRSLLHSARSLSSAPGRAGHLARIVAHAAIEDGLNGRLPEREALAALRLLPDPRLTA